MKNEIEIQIRVPDQTRYLRLIGNIGEILAREICHLPYDKDSCAYNMNLVLTEAISNAIKHAKAEDLDKNVTIRISISDNELAIRVYDSGQGFDLNSIPTPDVSADAVNETGRGIFIIRSIMDSVVYKKDNGGNVLEMKKAL